jgi:hypothetical protein
VRRIALSTALGNVGRRRREEKERALAEARENRARELERLATEPGFELAVSGSSHLLLACGLVLLGACLLFGGFSAESYAGRGLALAAAAFTLMLATPVLLLGASSLGKPILVLTREGFRTPLTPLIPWSRIDGIALKPNRARDRIVSHSLFFRIRTLPLFVGELGLAYRLIYRFRSGRRRERLHVVLRATKESPEVIYRVSRVLWGPAAGPVNDWDPDIEDLPETMKAMRWMNIVVVIAVIGLVVTSLIGVFGLFRS